MNASQSRWGRISSILIIVFMIVIRLRPSTARGGEIRENLLVEVAGYGDDKLSYVFVTGSVNCDAGLDGDSEPHAWPVSGAKVAVVCKTGRQNRKTGRQNRKPDTTQAWTDEYGDFIVDLPSHLHAIPNLEKACSVRVFSLPKSTPCKRVFLRKPQGIRLTSLGNGIRTYTTGRIKFQQPPRPSQKVMKN